MRRNWIISRENYPNVIMPASKNRLFRTIENYKKNSLAFECYNAKMLHGQKTVPLRDMVYGTYPLSWNGCELIAVANVCALLGKPVPLPQVIYEFELNRMHYVFPSGYWGTAPKLLYRFMDKHGLEYQSCRSAKDFVSAAENSFCGIVSFWNNKRSTAKLGGLDFFSGGLHTVAYSRKNGRFYVYNLYSRDRSARIFKDISEIYREKRFIIGYTFDKQ